MDLCYNPCRIYFNVNFRSSGLAVGFVGGALASQGNSGFLGALVAGFAAGYLIKLRKLFDYFFEGLKQFFLYPFFGLLLMALLDIYYQSHQLLLSIQLLQML